MLSIVVPGIRTHLWYRLYSSLLQHISDDAFELILVGPYNLPEDLCGHENIKYVRR